MKKGIWTLYPVKIYPKYYVKGTTLRLLRNMHLEDLTTENNNGWIGCDKRNQAKRLIARNRQKLKEKEKEKENGNWLKHTISVEKGKPLELENCYIFEYFEEK